MLPVYEPHIGKEEADNLAVCARTGWVSYLGDFVKQFESDFSAYIGASNAVAVQSGTSALHLALIVLGVGEGDEVIVPDMTFVASVFAIRYTGAVPVFCDIDPQTWTIDIEDAKKRVSDKTKAIMPVHLLGHPCDMDPLMEFADAEGLIVIEDASQSLGARYRGKHTGIFGNAGCFSFNGNKLVTCGGGGMITFRDDADAERAFHLSTQAKMPGGRFIHDAIAYNYRLTNIQAAVGVAQLARVDKVIERHRRRTDLYKELLGDIPGISFRHDAGWAETNEWLVSILFSDELARKRDEILKGLAEKKIFARPFFDPMSIQPPFINFSAGPDRPVACEIGLRGINLPSSYQITDDEIRFVCETLKDLITD